MGGQRDDWLQRQRAAYRDALSGTVRLRRNARIDPPRTGSRLQCVGVGPRGEMVALWLAAQHEPGPGVDARSAAGPPAIVSWHGAGEVRQQQVPHLTARFPLVQPQPDGIVVVDSRSHAPDESPRHNATGYDEHGDVTATGWIGDAVAYLQSTTGGLLWSGHFDEGVFGDPAQAGLARWSPRLEQEWDNRHEDAMPSVDDCYAMNVTDVAVHVHVYSDLVIARVTDTEVATWSTTGIGARGILVGADQVALIGGYTAEGTTDRVVIGSLGDDGVFHPRRTLRLVMPDGLPLPTGTRRTFHCRGSRLHLVIDRDWFVLDLNDLDITDEGRRPSYR